MADSTSTYADRLREALDRDGWSQARLVRELAERTGNVPESERSAVRGYLRKSLPRPGRAQMIAEITGVAELATVVHPRQSAADRLERRLEELAKNQAEMLQNQEAGMEELTGRLEAISATLALLAGDARIAPKPSPREDTG